MLRSAAILALLLTSTTFAQAESASAEPATASLGPAVFLSIDGERAYRVSDWLGAPVSLKDGEGDIGEVESLILDPNGATVAAIIGVGGFLGVGEKDIAVSIDSLSASTEDGDVMLELDATREQIDSAEPVVLD